MLGADLPGREHFVVHRIGSRHGADVLELVHSLPRVGEPDCANDVVVDWIAHLVPEPAVEIGRVLLELKGPASREGRTVSGRVPSRTRGQFILFKKDAILPSGFRQMVQATPPTAPPPMITTRVCSVIFGSHVLVTRSRYAANSPPSRLTLPEPDPVDAKSRGQPIRKGA